MSAERENVPVVQVAIAAWNFFLRNLQTTYLYGMPFVICAFLGGWISAFVPSNSPLAGLAFLLVLASWVCFWIMSSAQYRLALGMEETGFAGFSLGGDEFRLFMTVILVSLIAYIVAFVAAIIGWLVISSVLLSGVDPAILPQEPRQLLQYFIENGANRFWFSLLLGAALVWSILLYLFSRFAPAFPAAIAERTIVIFEAANWSKGQGIRIAAASILAFFPFYVLTLPDILASAGFQFSIMMSDPQPSSVEMGEALRSAAQKNFHWHLLTILVTPALNAVRVGAYVTLYRGLRPVD